MFGFIVLNLFKFYDLSINLIWFIKFPLEVLLFRVLSFVRQSRSCKSMLSRQAAVWHHLVDLAPELMPPLAVLLLTNCSQFCVIVQTYVSSIGKLEF